MASRITNWGEKEALRVLFDPIKQPRLHLAKAWAPFDETMDVGNITEADFPNYGSILLDALPAPATDGNGRGQIDAGLKQFVRGEGGTPQTLVGFYITVLDQNATRHVYAAMDFAPPIVLTAPGQTVDVTLKLLSTETV